MLKEGIVNMARTEPFDTHSQEYEQWFDKNPLAYQSELEAVRAQLPETGEGFEIGVGSGLFAVPLGIRHGVEPSEAMRELARNRGIEAVPGVAENLPYEDASFDYALMVTTICFVDDPAASFREAMRVLRPRGVFLIGFIDRESPIGRMYEKHKHESVFYRPATFYSVPELEKLLLEAGFRDISYTQTIFSSLDEISEVEPARPGWGEGSFVVIRAEKP
jgi:SAM-dependent methyltransferase